MPRRIQDFTAQSVWKFKFDMVAQWLDNKENDQKKADDEYTF